MAAWPSLFASATAPGTPVLAPRSKAEKLTSRTSRSICSRRATSPPTPVGGRKCWRISLTNSFEDAVANPAQVRAESKPKAKDNSPPLQFHGAVPHVAMDAAQILARRAKENSPTVLISTVGSTRGGGLVPLGTAERGDLTFQHRQSA